MEKKGTGRERIPTKEPERLALESSQHDGITVLHGKGEADIYTGGWLYDEVVKHLDAGQNKLVVDLTKVNYVDAHTWKLLLRALTQARECQGDISLVVVAQNIRRIMKIAKIDQVFSPHDSIGAATAQLA